MAWRNHGQSCSQSRSLLVWDYTCSVLPDLRLLQLLYLVPSVSSASAYARPAQPFRLGKRALLPDSYRDSLYRLLIAGLMILSCGTARCPHDPAAAHVRRLRYCHSSTARSSTLAKLCMPVILEPSCKRWLATLMKNESGRRKVVDRTNFGC
jgi:hypothetical protein